MATCVKFVTRNIIPTYVTAQVCLLSSPFVQTAVEVPSLLIHPSEGDFHSSLWLPKPFPQLTYIPNNLTQIHGFNSAW